MGFVLVWFDCLFDYLGVCFVVVFFFHFEEISTL